MQGGLHNIRLPSRGRGHFLALQKSGFLYPIDIKGYVFYPQPAINYLQSFWEWYSQSWANGPGE